MDATKHKFKNDKDFEKHVVSGEYKENTLLDAIRKVREIEQLSNKKLKNVDNKNAIRTRLPTDLSSIKATLNKFK